jgi:hypothetical protein
MFGMNHKKHDTFNRMDITTNITNFKSDIDSFKTTISDSLIAGANLFVSQPGITSEVNMRTTELIAKKNKLNEDIKKQEAVIRRSERDFIDVRDTLPETIPNKKFHFLEDYTLVFLLISYLFMLAIALHTYVFTYDGVWTSALLKGGFYSLITTLLFGMILYYIC